jgi:hypothetical protein
MDHALALYACENRCGHRTVVVDECQRPLHILLPSSFPERSIESSRAAGWGDPRDLMSCHRTSRLSPPHLTPPRERTQSANMAAAAAIAAARLLLVASSRFADGVY